jgi:putative N6-adenine-specific DNA methylase
MLALLWGDQGASFVDPMCGSGTLPIEAALRARKVPPGWNRHFAFEAWPSFEERVWRSVRATAAARIQTRAPGQIVGFDRDAGAIEAAVANAARAGVQDDVSFERRALSTARPPTERGKGLVAVNPPYGERVTGGPELRNLYARLGDVVREHFEGWAFGILAADPRLVSQLRLPLQQRFATTNGGIRVAYWTMGEPAARA